MDGQVQYAQTIKEINQVMNTAAKEYKAHISALGNDATATQKLVAQQKKLQVQTEAAEKRTKMLRKEYEESVKATGENSKESKKLYDRLLQAETAENNLKNALDKTNKELKEQEKASKFAADNIKKIGEAGEKIKGVGTKITAGVTVPIMAIGGFATKQAIEVETQFAKVSTLLDSSQVDFQKYKNEIAKTATDMGVSFEEYSESVYSAISASVDQADAVNFVGDAVKLAKGGFTETATAVDLLTTTINAYNLKATDAGKISDYLISTQNLGKTTVNELASSMGKVIPIANANNVGMNELSTAYAVMTKNGIATAETGTMVKAMLNELGKTGSQADKALKEIAGKSFKQLMDEGNNLSDVLNLMNEHAHKNGLALNDMFGSVEAGTAALTLSKGEGSEYNEILKQINDSAGATQEAFDKMDDTPARKMEKAQLRIADAMRQVGEVVIPIVADIAEKVSQFVTAFSNWFGSLDEGSKQTILMIAGVVAAIGPVLVVLGTLASSISSLIPVIAFIASPIGLVIAAVAAWVAAIVVAYNKIGWFRDFINTSFKVIKDIVVGVFNVLKDTTKSTFDFITGFIGGAMDGAAKIIGDYVNAIKRIFGGIVDFVTGVFTGDWSRAWQGVVDIFGGIFEGIAAVAKAPINAMITLINGFIGGLNNIKIPKWVPGIGGKGFHIGKIPYLAEGGHMINGQAIVGEAGPELLTAKNGKTTVTPLSQDEKSKGISGALKGSSTVNNYVTIGQVDANNPSEINRLNRKMFQANVWNNLATGDV
ncbi:phage tail tape measure protein [Enterococcus faecalis]|uniref:phage tail tape measure protein n=1 Tax=Enterococcus faecalis TaxID=1351 RepID=UPI001559D18F|nr:phage tail tape measure protein [Enterococcus faecalis]MBW4131637.1 phage tail tape measure protein [Enterococcus faecalis]UDM45413.1 phage tail tape measure protein [Enterococcus faecalis]